MSLWPPFLLSFGPRPALPAVGHVVFSPPFDGLRRRRAAASLFHLHHFCHARDGKWRIRGVETKQCARIHTNWSTEAWRKRETNVMMNWMEYGKICYSDHAVGLQTARIISYLTPLLLQLYLDIPRTNVHLLRRSGRAAEKIKKVSRYSDTNALAEQAGALGCLVACAA